MKKVLVIIIVVLVIAVAAVLAYSVFKKPEEATGPLEAVPIAAEVEQPSAAEPTAEPVAQATATPEPAPTEVPQAPAATDAPEPAEPAEVAATATDATEPTYAPEPTDPPAEPTSEEVPASAIFEIVPGETQARFLIDEVLRGSPVTVVGSTSEVAGQLSVDPADLSTAQVGTILVNARTIETDNEFRNRAIKNRILKTDDYELVTFVPQEVVGLAESGTVGESYTFQLVGDLTVTDVTKQVTFEVTVTPISQSRIEGLATTAFLYTDFSLAIPDAQAVDTVEDTVRLEFDFVAEAIQ